MDQVIWVELGNDMLTWHQISTVKSRDSDSEMCSAHSIIVIYCGLLDERAPRPLFIRRLDSWSHEISKPRDIGSKLFSRFVMQLVPRQHCCQSTCQILEPCYYYSTQSRGTGYLAGIDALQPELLKSCIAFASPSSWTAVNWKRLRKRLLRLWNKDNTVHKQTWQSAG